MRDNLAILRARRGDARVRQGRELASGRRAKADARKVGRSDARDHEVARLRSFRLDPGSREPERDEKHTWQNRVEDRGGGGGRNFSRRLHLALGLRLAATAGAGPYLAHRAVLRRRERSRIGEADARRVADAQLSNEHRDRKQESAEQIHRFRYYESPRRSTTIVGQTRQKHKPSPINKPEPRRSRSCE